MPRIDANRGRIEKLPAPSNGADSGKISKLQARRRWSRLYRVGPGAILVVFVVGLVWADEQFELPGWTEGMSNLITFGLFFAAGPILGITWGGRARTPWRALALSMVAFAGAGAGAGAGAAMSVRAGVRHVNLFAAIIGCFAVWALIGLLVDRSNESEFAYFIISMLILPVMNGGLDYISWWVSRFLGHDLARGLSDTASTAVTLTRSLSPMTADLILALVFFVAMAFALGLAFESYDLYADLPAITLFAKTEFGPLGYAEDLRADPLGAGLRITLMLLTTLIPTDIRFGMVLGATLPATLLPDRRRQALAEALATLGQTPPPKDTPDRETWAATIRDSAKFAAAYRWRMLWGVGLTLGLSAMLVYGLAQLYPHLSLAKWAYQGGVLGIETAQWFFGH